jgi:hypothetical protein
MMAPVEIISFDRNDCCTGVNKYVHPVAESIAQLVYVYLHIIQGYLDVQM